MKRAILVVVFSLVCTAFAAEQTAVPSGKEASAHEPQLSLGYVYQGSQGVGSSWFGMNGGRADVMFPVARHWGVVAEFSGVHTDSVGSSPAQALTLFTYMAGPRFSFAMHRGHEAGRLTPFVQVLFGGTHATEGAFPSGTTLKSTADAFAMSAGGGLQVGINRRTSVRLIQAEYLYTRLPNLLDNYQNNYRIGAGVVFRWR